MKALKFIVITLLLFTVSCSDNEEIAKEESQNFNYLTFGHFFGSCGGDNCVQTFQLTNDKLFKDTISDYTGEDLNFTELSNEKYELVKDLMDAFPAELLNSDEDFFGCPDCSDGGGLFIQYSENGILKSWRIDLFKTNVPEYLHDFMDEVQEKIALINE